MNVVPMTFGGLQYTAAALIQLFQGQIDAVSGVSATKGTWLNAIQKEKDLRVKVASIVTGLKAYVLQAFPGNTEALADFGFAAKKKATPKTAEQKAVIALKAKATRAARHTMGSKQKLAVTGTVPATVPATPAPAVPPPAAPPAVPPTPPHA
jgi:hypothetical protein